MRLLAVPVLLLAFGASPRAQARSRLEARVTAAAGSSVYLDQGREAGVAIGDAVRLLVPGQLPLDVVVQAVSRSSARADLPAGSPVVPVGTRAEITVAARERDGEGAGAERRSDPTPRTPTVDHPPWTQPLGEVDPNRPLLAPAFGRGPAERPVDLHGRLFTSWYHTWDRGLDERRYLAGRTGADFDVENPLGKGGALHFDGELAFRRTFLDDAPDDSSGRPRLDRLSYSWGDDELAPVRFEVGRFLQNQFPELGRVDGGEVAVPVGEHGAVGTSFGLMPEPFGAGSSSDDLQATLSYRYDAVAEGGVRAGLAAQKTWHKGSPDRDLLFGDFFWRGDDGLLVQLSSWVDLYTSRDTIKDRGLQLTELHARTAYDFSADAGAGLSLAQIRWPELKRMEFTRLPPDLVRDNRTTRLGADVWWRATERWRFDVRGDWWEDQTDQGWAADLRTHLRDVPWERGDLWLSVFHNEGSFTEGRGVRLGGSRSFGPHRLGVRYDFGRYDNTTLFGSDASLDLHGLGAELDLMVSRTIDLSIDFDYRFGDAQDTFTLGIYGQMRF